VSRRKTLYYGSLVTHLKTRVIIMKLSEFIEELQKLYEKHGDLPVRRNDSNGEVLVSYVDAFNENDNKEQKDGIKENHVFIH